MSWNRSYEMANAFVLINCEPGSDDYLVSKLQSIKTVITACGTFGSYDIIVQLNSESQENLKNTITKNIRRLDKILSTITLLLVERSKVLDEVFTKKQEKIKDKNLAEAFIIIRCKNMSEYDTLHNLSNISEVIDGDIVVGQYVIICKVAAPTYNEIEDVVTKKIRKVQGINSTMTLNVIPSKRTD
jgi:DNA-binding Lrp family transcriptional regulator